MSIDVDQLYRQHLTESDRRLLRSAVPDGPMVDALGSVALEAAVFGPVMRNPVVRSPAPDAGAAAGPGSVELASPFLTFAVAVHRSAAALTLVRFVDEHLGPGRRIPVFDTPALTAMLSDPLRRYFFVELLASYTRVSSGVAWRHTARGWRRQRFSDLDPVRLAAMLDLVGPEERPGVYRRLGDLALFLGGVFPDHPAIPAGAGTERVLRHSGLQAHELEGLAGSVLLEHLGASWYRCAIRLARAAGQPVTGTLAVAEEVAERFTDARRVLNAVTDRYLFPLRSRWFPA